MVAVVVTTVPTSSLVAVCLPVCLSLTCYTLIISANYTVHSLRRSPAEVYKHTKIASTRIVLRVLYRRHHAAGYLQK